MVTQFGKTLPTSGGPSPEKQSTKRDKIEKGLQHTLTRSTKENPLEIARHPLSSTLTKDLSLVAYSKSSSWISFIDAPTSNQSSSFRLLHDFLTWTPSKVRCCNTAHLTEHDWVLACCNRTCDTFNPPGSFSSLRRNWLVPSSSCL